MADEEVSDKRAGGFSVNKFVVAVLIFMALGLLIEAVTSYSQRTVTQTTLENRAVVGDENLRLNKENNEMIKQLKEQVNNLENKLNNGENTGKPVK